MRLCASAAREEDGAPPAPLADPAADGPELVAAAAATGAPAAAARTSLQAGTQHAHCLRDLFVATSFGQRCFIERAVAAWFSLDAGILVFTRRLPCMQLSLARQGRPSLVQLRTAFIRESRAAGMSHEASSQAWRREPGPYTHMTLPTILRADTSAVAALFTNKI